MTNVKTLWRSVYVRVFIFTTCFIKKIENWTLRHKLWKHTWYAWNYRLCLLLLKYTAKMEYLQNWNPFFSFLFGFSLLCIICWDITIANWTSPYAVYICTSCLGLGVIMNDKVLYQLVAMLFSQQWSLSSNLKAMLIFLLLTLLFSISKLCYKLFLAWKWSQVFYNPPNIYLVIFKSFSLSKANRTWNNKKQDCVGWKSKFLRLQETMSNIAWLYQEIIHTGSGKQFWILVLKMSLIWYSVFELLLNKQNMWYLVKTSLNIYFYPTKIRKPKISSR